MTSKMRFRAIPQVPTKVDPDTRRFLAALKENFEIVAGMRGDANAVIELLGYTPEKERTDPWPAFQVTSHPYPSADQALTADKIIGYTTSVNTVRLNNGNNFDTATGRFTIPEDGIYRFEVTITRSGGNAAAVISKNGAQISEEALSHGTDWQTATTFVVQSFVKGDYVQGIFGVRNSTTVAAYGSNFSGYLVRQT